MDKMEEMLTNNQPIRTGEWSTPEVEMIKEKLPQLITTKPIIYLVNLTKKDFIRKKNKWLVKIHTWIKEHGGGMMIPFSVEFEEELWGLREDEEAQRAFLDGRRGQERPPGRWWFRCATHPTPRRSGERRLIFPIAARRPTRRVRSPFSSRRLVSQGYKELNLIYYFTAGEKEVRCWTLYNGALAPQAAGVIHSDFERGFIKAEVVAYEDFKALATGKSMAEVKAAGKYRQRVRPTWSRTATSSISSSTSPPRRRSEGRLEAVISRRDDISFVFIDQRHQR